MHHAWARLLLHRCSLLAATHVHRSQGDVELHGIRLLDASGRTRCWRQNVEGRYSYVPLPAVFPPGSETASRQCMLADQAATRLNQER